MDGKKSACEFCKTSLTARHVLFHLQVGRFSMHYRIILVLASSRQQILERLWNSLHVRWTKLLIKVVVLKHWIWRCRLKRLRSSDHWELELYQEKTRFRRGTSVMGQWCHLLDVLGKAEAETCIPWKPNFRLPANLLSLLICCS